METEIALHGAGGHGKVIADILYRLGYRNLVFVDFTAQDSFFGFPVLPLSGNFPKTAVLSVGDNKLRKKIDGELDAEYFTPIHPNAMVADTAALGEGTVVMAGAVVNPDATIGRHCIINTGAIVEHDCVIGDFVHIAPNAALAGHVILGEGTNVGIGACIIQGIKVGKWATIGAGAVVIRDVPDDAVVVGNPGEIIKYNSHE